MSKLQFVPQEGATPSKYLTIPEQEYLDSIKEGSIFSSYKETSDCYIKCSETGKYLSANRDAWLDLSTEKHRWKAYWKKGKNKGSFFLQSREKGPYKGHYIGHQKISDCAGMFTARASSDWLELEEKMLINIDYSDRHLGEHKKNGYLYWISRKEAQKGYKSIRFVLEDA
jgi:hypothetical protein